MPRPLHGSVVRVQKRVKGFSAAPSWDFEGLSIALEQTLIGKAVRHARFIILLIFWLRSSSVGGADLTDELLLAARQGQTDVIRALLASGANVDAKNFAGETALMQAAERSHTDVVELL